MKRLPAGFWLDLAVMAALVGLLLIAVLKPKAGPAAARRKGHGRSSGHVSARGDHRPDRVGGSGAGIGQVTGTPSTSTTRSTGGTTSTTFLNWGLLVAACGQFLVRFPLGRVVSAALMIGFGAVTAILWEFGEYFTFIRGGPEERTAYTDTLGDLAGGLSGSTLAALLTVTLA